jgi:hypothetical protein
MNHEEQEERANFIKSLLIVNFGLDDCVILWNDEQAKQHGGHLPGSHAIGFAMQWQGMTAICPIAKSVAFDQKDGYFDGILELCGVAFNGRLALAMAESVGI